MILFVVDEGEQKHRGRAVRASILAHACLMQGLEVSFVCPDQRVRDCLIREGCSEVRVVEERDMLAQSSREMPTVLMWDAARLLTESEVRLLHQHGTFVVEFDAPDRGSFADEVVSGFETILCSALGHRFRLVGPNHLIVDKCFANAKEWRRASSFLRYGIDLFICFNGADTEQLTMTLEALAGIPACRSVQIRAMTGADAVKTGAIQRKFSALKNLQLYRGSNPALMAQLMRFSRLGIVSFGPLLAKAMAAELPVLLLNETETDEAAAARVLKNVFAGAGKTFGCASSIDWRMFRNEVSHLLERPREIERMQEAAHRLVDGRGAQRIARYVQGYTEKRVTGHATWVSEQESPNIIHLYS